MMELSLRIYNTFDPDLLIAEPDGPISVQREVPATLQCPNEVPHYRKFCFMASCSGLSPKLIRPLLQEDVKVWEGNLGSKRWWP